MAKCPAHADGKPSLSLNATRDGLVLMHCFAGCTTEDVLAAVGLELRDLYDRPLIDALHARTARRHAHAVEAALTRLEADFMILVLVLADSGSGKRLTQHSQDLFSRSMSHVLETVQVLYG